MAKRGFLFTAGCVLMGGVAALAIGEAATPGSAHKVVVAGTSAGMEAENGVGAFTSNGLDNLAPVLASGRDALAQSGIGNMLGGSPQVGADDPTAVPAAGSTDQR